MEQEEIDAIIQERLTRAKKKHADAMKARAEEVKMLEAKVKELTDKVSGFAELNVELDGLREKVQRADRLEIMRSNNIPAEALDDISAIYQSRMASIGEEEQQDWATFLGEEGMARQIVLLNPYFSSESSDESGVAPASQGVAVSTSSEAPVSRGLPNGNTGVTPLSSGQEKMSPTDLRRYFESNEYRSLPPDQQREKYNELARLHSAPQS